MYLGLGCLTSSGLRIIYCLNAAPSDQVVFQLSMGFSLKPKGWLPWQLMTAALPASLQHELCSGLLAYFLNCLFLPLPAPACVQQCSPNWSQVRLFLLMGSLLPRQQCFFDAFLLLASPCLALWVLSATISLVKVIGARGSVSHLITHSFY